MDSLTTFPQPKMTHSHETIFGIITGFLLSVYYSIGLADISHTIILSCLGAATGFITTFLLKCIIRRIKKYFNK